MMILKVKTYQYFFPLREKNNLISNPLVQQRLLCCVVRRDSTIALKWSEEGRIFICFVCCCVLLLAATAASLFALLAAAMVDGACIHVYLMHLQGTSHKLTSLNIVKAFLCTESYSWWLWVMVL
ncbi:unnamed protein product [Orchesella dallaii]|uniref:Uncharacterized protein n=1 Tax=Orchesella dallaii TaxID=48710 RepID=A0ABP1QB37_9HEXA